MTAFAGNIADSIDAALGDGLLGEITKAFSGVDANAQHADVGLLGGLGLAAAEFTKENQQETLLGG